MTLAEAARSVDMPAGSYRTAMAVCVVDDELRHRIAWFLDGIRKTAPTGPSFAKPTQACRLADFLNGRDRSTSRRTSTPDLAGAITGDRSASRDEASASPEAPIVADPRAAAATSSRCAGCGGPLPPGSRSDRRTCKPSCRVAVHRDGIEPLRRKAIAAAQSANFRANALGMEERITPDDVLELWSVQPTCVDCGKGVGLDHISPFSAGGRNVPTNLANRCPSCNSRKAAAERPGPDRAGPFRPSADTDSAVTLSEPTRPSVAEILADHVADVVAACNPPDPEARVEVDGHLPGSRSDRPLRQRPDPARVPASRAHPLSPGAIAGG